VPLEDLISLQQWTCGSSTIVVRRSSTPEVAVQFRPSARRPRCLEGGKPQWWTFRDIFGSKYRRLAWFGKPIRVAEFGLLAVGGNRAGWYWDALTAPPKKISRREGTPLSQGKRDHTATYQTLDWSITGDPVLGHTIAAAIKRRTPETPPVRP
jgi:hypothetical protein